MLIFCRDKYQYFYEIFYSNACDQKLLLLTIYVKTYLKVTQIDREQIYTWKELELGNRKIQIQEKIANEFHSSL